MYAIRSYYVKLGGGIDYPLFVKALGLKLLLMPQHLRWSDDMAVTDHGEAELPIGESYNFV